MQGSHLAVGGGPTILAVPVAAAVLSVFRGSLSTEQLSFDGSTCLLKQVADLLLQFGRLVNQAGIDFQFQIDAGSFAAVIRQSDLLRGADVEYEWHRRIPFVIDGIDLK